MPGAYDCKLYIGDLGSNATKEELEDAFSYYGRLRNVWVARNPPGFAFVEYEDSRDAEDAARALDGRTVCGRRVTVEFSTGKSRSRFNGGPPVRNRPFHPEDRCYKCGERGHYAYDCSRYHRRPRYGRSRSRSPRRRKSYSRSRSRSRSRGRKRSRDYRSLSRSKTRSRSKDKKSRSRSRSRSRGSMRNRSRSRERSRSRHSSGDRKRYRSRSRSGSREAD